MKKLVSLFILLLVLSFSCFTQTNSLLIVEVTSIEAIDMPAFIAASCGKMVETAFIEADISILQGRFE